MQLLLPMTQLATESATSLHVAWSTTAGQKPVSLIGRTETSVKANTHTHSGWPHQFRFRVVIHCVGTQQASSGRGLVPALLQLSGELDMRILVTTVRISKLISDIR